MSCKTKKKMGKVCHTKIALYCHLLQRKLTEFFVSNARVVPPWFDLPPDNPLEKSTVITMKDTHLNMHNTKMFKRQGMSSSIFLLIPFILSPQCFSHLPSLNLILIPLLPVYLGGETPSKLLASLGKHYPLQPPPDSIHKRGKGAMGH